MTLTTRTTKPRLAIVGAGLGGSLMANYLGVAGYEVDVYEIRDDPRTGSVDAGRSINLAISARGIHALEELGLAEDVMKMAIPMRGRLIHSRSGEVSLQPYDKDANKYINSISRAGLNTALIEAADRHDNVRLHFQHKCTGVDLKGPTLTMRTREKANNAQRRWADKEVSVDADIVLSADGAFSAVRSSMQRLDRFDFSQSYLKHGYKELCIPATSNGDFAMDSNALHIWPRRSFMMIALPNPDKTFTCTLFLAFDGSVSFSTLQSDQAVRRLFEQQFADAFPLMPTLLEDFRHNPTGSLATIRCSPWYYEDKVMLLGDAAHAIVPFYGQGMNCAFEDCTVLNECIDKYAPDWHKVFRVCHAQRKENADAIADLALHNFIEMRDHAGSRLFRLKKTTERTLHRFWPGYVPLYSMVSFSRIPYAEAVLRTRRFHRTATILGGILIVLLIVLLGAMV